MKTLIRVKRLVGWSVAAVLLMCGSVSRADLTGVTDWYNSTGVEYCYPAFSVPQYSDPLLGISATQTNAGPVSMWGTIIANSISDPNLIINNQINNESGVDWASFTVDVYMSTSFSLGFPATPVVSPSGWTGTISVTPHNTVGTTWWGQITFTGGTPVSANLLSPDNLLDYTYKILNFSGSTSYSFQQDVTVVPVPEPATFSLLGLGTLMLVSKFRRRN